MQQKKKQKVITLNIDLNSNSAKARLMPAAQEKVFIGYTDMGYEFVNLELMEKVLVRIFHSGLNTKD